jgi:anti-anti-sigma factor
MPSIRVESGGNHALVIAGGELDLASAGHLRDAIEEALSAAASVIVDLTDVVFIDSAIVGVIATASNDVARREAGAQIVVVSPPDTNPRRVLNMVQADAFVRICDDRASALRSTDW